MEGAYDNMKELLLDFIKCKLIQNTEPCACIERYFLTRSY